MTSFFTSRFERAAGATQMTLPQLSPGFPYADDAARYAHELIGDKRDVEYGGVILRRADGQFFATQPVKGASRMFSPHLVMSSDAHGNLLHPDGYTCYAFYHSHPNSADEISKAFPTWSSEAVTTSMNFFSPPDVVFAIGMRGFAAAAYLSGLNGSLIKYVPSGSADEEAVRVAFARALDRKKPMIDYIRSVAAVGELSVIQSNEIWGWKVGKLGADVDIYNLSSPVQTISKKVQQPAYSPFFASSLDAVKFARLRLYQQPERQYGYILKVRNKEQYLATEPVLGTASTFDPKNIFKKNAAGALILPRDLDVVALYYCDSLYHDPDHLPAEQTQVYKRFINPNALASGVMFSLALRFGRDVPPLPLYITVRDGALLEYQPSSTMAEEPFTRQLSAAEGVGLEIKRDLLDGHVSPTTYIQRLAQMGELKVMYHSDLWGRVGKVRADWAPYAHLRRRALSPLFITAEDAARYVHKKIKQSPVGEHIFGGLIFQRLDKRFVATEPLAGRSETFDPNGVIPRERLDLTPNGASIVGFYHSHRAPPSMLSPPGDEQKLYHNMLEPHEVYSAIQDRDWAASRFLSTSQGALLKYVPSGSVLEKKFTPRIAPPTDHPENVRHNTLQLKLRNNTLKPTAYVAQIVRTGDLYVVEGSALWGNPGKVDTSWRPSPTPVAVSQATDQPEYSPVFSQEEDAVRYAHQHMGARTKRQLGFILKCTHSQEYVATMPVEDGPLSLDRYFPRALAAKNNTLPAEFVFHAVYLGAPAKLFASPKDSENVRNLNTLLAFVTPVDLADALALVTMIKQQIGAFTGDVPVYISTNDGALLSYTPLNLASELNGGVFDGSGKVLLSQMRAGHLHVTEYVHRIAASGRLNVLIKSPVWNALGQVTSTFVPYRAAAPLPVPSSRGFVLGPVFAHADDAARYAHLKIVGPVRVNAVAGILQKSDYNTYVAIEPIADGEVANAPETILFTHKHVDGQLHPVPIFPSGYSRTSLLFSRTATREAGYSDLENEVLNNMFWPVDICYATSLLKTYDADNSFSVIYHSTRDGALLKYVRGTAMGTRQLCQPVSGANLTYEGYFVENNQPDRTTRSESTETLPAAKPSELLNRVLNSGQLSVVVVSRLWPTKGDVDNSLTITRSAVPQVDWDDPAVVQMAPVNGESVSSIPWHDEL